MKLVIFGATGLLGQRLVEQALAQGHHVTAFARNAALLPDRPRLHAFEGNVLDPERVTAALNGQEAAIVALGGDRNNVRKASSVGSPSIRTRGTKNIVAAMEETGVRRLICVSAYGVGDSRKRGCLYSALVWSILKPVFLDTEQQEEIVRTSSADWTLVRPSQLTDTPATGKYRVGLDLRLGLSARVARADVADFMLQQLTDSTYLHKAPEISS